MTDEDHLETDFAALLAALEDVLSPDQIWELETCIDYDELAVAFGLLCSMLQPLDAPLSESALELLQRVAVQLGFSEASWRGLAPPRRH